MAGYKRKGNSSGSANRCEHVCEGRRSHGKTLRNYGQHILEIASVTKKSGVSKRDLSEVKLRWKLKEDNFD